MTKRFRDEMSSADVGSASNMLGICTFMFSYETVMLDVLHFASRINASRHDLCVAPLTWLILPVVISFVKDQAMHVSI